MRSLKQVIFILFWVLTLCAISMGGQRPSFDELWAKLDSGQYQLVVESVRRTLETDTTAIDLLGLEVRAGLMSDNQPAYLDGIRHDSTGTYVSEWRRAIFDWEIGRIQKVRQFAEDRYKRTHDCWSQYWLARAMARLGQTDQAIEMLRSLLDSAQCRPAAQSELADVYSRVQNYAKSDSVYREMDRFDDAGKTWQCQRAWHRAILGDWPGGLEDVREIYKLVPLPYCAYSEISLLRGLGRFREAYTAARTALRRWPSSRRLQMMVAECAEKLEYESVADSLLRRLTPFQMGYLESSILSDRAARIGDTLAYDTLMRSYVAANIDDPYQVYMYTRWLRMRNRSDEADALLDSVHRCASLETDIWVRVATVSEEEPSKALDTLLAITPAGFDRGILNLWQVTLRYNDGLVDSAHQVADRILTRTPGDLGLLLDVVRRDIAFRRFERTDDWLARLERAGYDSIETGMFKVQWLLVKGEMGQAGKLLDSLVAMCPNYPDLVWYLPRLYGDEDNLEKLGKLAENYLGPQRNTLWACVELTPILNMARRGRTADSLLSEALIQNPNASVLYYLRGMTRSSLGDYQASSVDLAQAKALDPFNPDLAQASTTGAQKGLTLDQAGTSAETDTTGMPHITVDSIRALVRVSEFDSTDNVVVLAEHEQQIYDIDGHHLRRIHRIAWGRTADGARSLGSASYSFSGYSETPRVLIARTIDPDGSIHDVPKEKVYISNEESGMSDSRIVTWAYPQSDSGAIVEALIQFEGGYNDPLDVYGSDVFTENFRVVSREMELRTPSLWPMIVRQSNGIKREEKRVGGSVTNKFVANHLAKFIEEEQMPGAAEQCELVRYSYQKTWKQEAEFYWSRASDKIDTGQVIKALGKRLVKGLSSKTYRINALFRYVADSIRYEAINFGEGTTIPRTGTATLNNGFGDCKDKTVLLLSLLRAVGIDGYPALLSTNDATWFDPLIPDMAQFNHMIAFVPDAEKPWLDPTCSACQPGDISADNQGKPALIVRPGIESPLDTIPTPTAKDDQLVRKIRVTPKDDGGSTLDLKITFVGPVALNLRNNMPQNSATDIRRYFESQMGVGLTKMARLTDYALTEQTPKGMNYNMTARFVADSSFGKGFMYAKVPINLYQIGLRFNLPDTVNRRLDVQRDRPFSEIEQVTVVPGRKWELFNSPVSWDQENEWFKAECAVQSFSDSITITSSFMLKTRRISRGDYPKYYGTVERMQNRLFEQSPEYRRRPDSTRLEALAQALSKSPDDPSLLVSVAKEYLGGDLGGTGCRGEKNRTTAIEYYMRALAAGPNNEMTLMQLAPLLISAGRLKLADSVLHAFSGAGSMPVLLSSFRAATAEQLGRHAEAIPMLESVLASSPDDRIRSSLVLWYIAADQLDKAKQQLDLMETLRSDSANLMQPKLAYCLAIKDWPTAEDLIKHWPDTSAKTVRQLWMSIFQTKGDYEAVAKMSKDMLAVDPEDYWALNTCAWALYKLNRDLPDALEMAERALAIRGDCEANVRNTRGAILLGLGKTDAAERDFLAALSDETARAGTINLYFLGKCAVLRKQSEKARAYFAESISLNGDKEYAEMSRKELEKL